MNIDVSDLDVSFGSLAALQGIACRIPAGRITAVIGPNAAGKTTLLRCIAGVLEPQRGEVRLDGVPVRSMEPAARARRIAYLGQRSSVVGGHTVAEVVGFGGLGRTRSEEGILESLRDVGLERDASRRYQELSAGQQQRVSLARTVYQVGHGEKGWLVLDEPFAAQDPREVVRILERLSAWRAAGHSAVVAIHDLRIARAISDEVILVRGGRLFSAGQTGAELVASRMSELFEVPFVDTPFGPIAGFDPSVELGSE